MKRTKAENFFAAGDTGGGEDRSGTPTAEKDTGGGEELTNSRGVAIIRNSFIL